MTWIQVAMIWAAVAVPVGLITGRRLAQISEQYPPAPAEDLTQTGGAS